jgi:hypothetical protein
LSRIFALIPLSDARAMPTFTCHEQNQKHSARPAASVTRRRKLVLLAVAVVVSIVAIRAMISGNSIPPISATFLCHYTNQDHCVGLRLTNRTEFTQHYACFTVEKRGGKAYGIIPPKFSWPVVLVLPNDYPTHRTTRVKISGYRQPAGIEITYLRLKRRITGIGVPRASWEIWVEVPPKPPMPPRPPKQKPPTPLALFQEPAEPPSNENDAWPFDIFAPIPSPQNSPLP